MADKTDEIDISRADLNRDEQIALLRSGVKQWNSWRDAHTIEFPDLTQADLHGANLSHANLAFAKLVKADLRGAKLIGAILGMSDLTQADLRRADLSAANLTLTTLAGANLAGARLEATTLILTSFNNATLDGCEVYGVSAWDVRLFGAKQMNLRITRLDEPAITVDDLRVAQFLNLLLNNREIRDVLDTIASKVVLILGAFPIHVSLPSTPCVRRCGAIEKAIFPCSSTSRNSGTSRSLRP
jgi:uncharacterized protein YjbI with pentapeptide repeats